MHHLLIMCDLYRYRPSLIEFSSSGMKEEQEVLVTHGYGITNLGSELKIIATSDGYIQGMQLINKLIN